MKFSLMGLVTGGCFSPFIFFSVWDLCAKIWSIHRSLEYVHVTRINNDNPIVFLLPTLIFLGAIAGGMVVGNKVLHKTQRREMSIYGAAFGGILGTIPASFIFTVIEYYRQFAF